MQLIRTKADLRRGVVALVSSCRYMARIHALAGEPPLRRRASGFKGLCRVVVGQQVSIASANAIWQRLESRVRPFTTTTFLNVPQDDMRQVGLSAVKIDTLRRRDRKRLARSRCS